MSVEENSIAWAMKLLEREPDYQQNYLAKHWSRIWATSIGIAIPLVMNAWLKRPLWAGIHRFVISGVVGFGVGSLITEREKYVWARTDAIMRDYIRLHPEDFPPPDTKKIGDIFEPWVPVR